MCSFFLKIFVSLGHLQVDAALLTAFDDGSFILVHNWDEIDKLRLGGGGDSFVGGTQVIGVWRWSPL